MESIEAARQHALTVHRSGDLDRAERLYRALVDTHPEDGESWHLLGVLNGQFGRHAEVVRCCEQALSRGFRSPSVLANLGLAQRELGHKDEALNALDQSLAMDPSDADLTLDHLQLLRGCGRELEALRRAGEACARFPRDARMHAEMGQLAAQLNDGQLAEESFRQAVRLEPDAAETWIDLGSILLMRGDGAGAEFAYRRALAMAPQNPHAGWYLSQLPGAGRDAEFTRRVVERARSVDDAAAAPWLFAAARTHDAAGAHDDAFAAWARGNRLIRGTFTYAIDADVDALLALADNLDDAGPTPDLPEGVPPPDRPTPIFIVGMPRSGSTLLEAMLANHPDIRAGGEVVWLQRFVHQAVRTTGSPWPAGQLTLGEERLASIRKRYLEAIELRARGSRYVTDKLPGNFNCIPTIRRLFPDALILHARRDRLETCWSCYRHLFAGTQQFAYDLEEVGRYCTAAHRVVDRCRRAWPDHVMEMRYEKLVLEPEALLRNIIDRLALRWDPACLAPAARDDMIQSASAQQVRTGLAAAPMTHAAAYARHLQPLREALDRAAEISAARPKADQKR